VCQAPALLHVNRIRTGLRHMPPLTVALADCGGQVR
jgi:hypothetical protein